MSSLTIEPLHPVRRSISGEDGITINVWDYGGDGPNLLLCHCTGTLARIWDPVVRALAGRFRCIAPDTRGQGDSATPSERSGYAWKLSGLDLLHLVDTLKLEAPLLAAGHSAGGAHVAYAEHYRPGVFERVLLIDSIIGPGQFFDEENNPLAHLVRKRINVFPDLNTARERFRSKPPMKTWVPEAVEAYLAHGLRERPDGQWELKCPGDREAWFYELGGASDVFEELDQMPVKTTLLAGDESDTRALAQLQHERLPHAELRMVAGAGHFIVQEMPELVASEILRWAEGI